MNRESALMDIYRVMRPGEPPTEEGSTALFETLFGDPERYDLSAVGRVKMNMRLDLDKPDTQRTLDREDIVSCVKALTECATAAATSTISTISATAACARSAS